MTTWKFKNCPRCTGDMFIERDVDGLIERCLLCGYSRDISKPKNIVSTASGTKR
ncbi:MAG: hypothetical protein JSV77_09720 [Dehalococcoidales bacterium]|nr:MAG: hypothetical protein JSV77_09720 [Dehalococcoidales bacterium]